MAAREVRYCTAEDGVRIAYTARGNGPCVVFCPQFVESFSLIPTYEPTVEEFFQTFEAEWRVVLYDGRGTGMSQRDSISSLSPDAQSLDLEAVMGAIGGEAYAIIAWTVATSVALRYVLRRPGTISKLIIGNGGAQLADSGTRDAISAFAALARANWPVAAQTFADLGPRDEEPEEATQLARILRDSTTGETVARIFAEAFAGDDISSVISSIEVPTLVVHHLDNRTTPVSVARSLAAAIPNARLALLPGGSGWYTQGNALEAMQQFLADGRPQPPVAAESDPSDATIVSRPPREAQSFASGRYVVVRPLGAGGQKSVFLVHDNALDRDCALALIRNDDLGPDDLLRFQREAQAMARLGAHSNIVSVFDIGEQDGRPFLVSEYIAGGDLRQLLLKRGRLPLAEAIAVSSDIARALAVAHARGVVHRDVKPLNIWLTEDGAAKLGDFGLAFSLDRSRLTMPGTVMGTAAYLSPEQALGEPVTERSDLYSLGCLLYEMVCGRPPFADANATAVIAQHLNAAPAAPSLHEPDVPPVLEDLILRLLAKSPAQRPESASVVLEELRRIGDGTTTITSGVASLAPSPAADAADAVVFVGRGAELEQLEAALERTAGGAGSLAMLVGEPGIGKTRLLDRVAAIARTRGIHVLSGHCYDGDWAPPFSPFVEAIKQHATHTPSPRLAEQLGADAGVLARIVPALRERLPAIEEPPQIPAEGERYRLLEATSSFFERIATHAPVVLMLDDLHWADKGTIAMLQQVARTSATQRVLVLGAYRDVELDRTHPLADALAGLRRERHFERIALRGLDGAEVAELLDAIAEQDVPAALSEAIARETDGNPFFIKEVLLHLVEEGKIVQSDGAWTSKLSITEMGIPEGVREVIGRRLSRVSETCGRMLTVASALTAGFSWEVISAIALTPGPSPTRGEGSPSDDSALLDAIDEALGAQLIVERERGRYDFTHALIRHTLYEELSTPRRVLMHRQIGEALERLYAGDIEPHLAELAHHFYECSAGAPAKAVDYCRRAGDRAIELVAFDEASLHYERAVELHADGGPEPLAELLLALGRAEYKAGQFRKSRETFMRAGDAARLAGNAGLFVRAALQEFRIWGDDDAELCAFIKEALDRLPDEESVLRARVMGCLAWRTQLDVSDEDRGRLFDAAIAMARKFDDGFTLPYVLKWWHWGHRRDPDTQRRLQVGAEFYTLASQSKDAILRLMAPHSRIYDSLAIGDIAETEKHVQEFCRLADEFKIPQYRSLGVQYWVALELLRGDHSQIEQRLADRESDTETGADLQTAVSLFFLRRDQGRNAELVNAWSALVDDATAVGVWVRVGLCVTYSDLGKNAEALDLLRRCTLEDLGTIGPDWQFLAAPIAEVIANLGDLDRAKDFYAALMPYRSQSIVLGQGALCLGAADSYLGLLASTMGRLEDAQHHFEDALAMNTRMGARPWVARTQLDYARMLRKRSAAGDAARARELLQQALATAQEIGMAKVAADCEALLASAP
ncbi:MAG: protein kinase [Chloroflexota bacterium]|nr:protein kinase [Chloroflexota bacterium]